MRSERESEGKLMLIEREIYYILGAEKFTPQWVPVDMLESSLLFPLKQKCIRLLQQKVVLAVQASYQFRLGEQQHLTSRISHNQSL